MGSPVIFLLLTASTLLQSSPASPLPGGTRLSCQPGFAPSQTEVSYPGSVCEPCEETGVAYPGNNLHLTPHYDVASLQDCRDLCREENNCRYFTFDTQANWCYLKSDKNPRAVSEETGQAGKTKYISGSSSLLCQSQVENEISQEEDPVQPVQPVPARSSPVLSVYDEQGDRTVLAALPATFGASVERETQISGELVAAQTSLCIRHSSEDQPPPSLPRAQVTRLALVFRGGCKFATKAENAGRAGWDGLVILDNQNNTRVTKISGLRSPLTGNMTVIFLLKTEADILLRLMAGSDKRNVSITDSSSFFNEDSTTARATTTTTTTATTATTATATKTSSTRFPRFPSRYDPREEDFRRDFLSKFGSEMFRKNPPYPEGLYRHPRPQARPPVGPPASARPAHVATVSQNYSQHSDRVIIQSSPLTIGSITVGVIVGLLLLISLVTLIVGRVRRKARRRAQHTRCQLAIRQFDAMNNSLAKDNGGFTEDQSSPTVLPPVRALPRSTYSLLECPVCLELAWPPKKIYQCREGHIVCDACKANPNLKTCPMCRISFSNNLTSRNRSLEELARTLREEETVTYLQDLQDLQDTTTTSIVTRAIPSAPPGPPPPDIVNDLSSEETEPGPGETEPDTRQLIGDSNPEAVRRLSLSTEVASVNLVVNLPPEV